MVEDNPKIIVEYMSDAAVVTLTDEKILEVVDIQAIENSLTPLIEQTAGIKIVLDFSKVQFLSSAVLGMLIRMSLLQNLGKQRCGSERRQGESMLMGVLDRICAGFRTIARGGRFRMLKMTWYTQTSPISVLSGLIEMSLKHSCYRIRTVA